MRILRLTALLLIATFAYAQKPLREVVTWSSIDAPHTQFLVTVKDAQGPTENHLVAQPDVFSMTKYRAHNLTPLAKRILRFSPEDNTCYFIRSYIMHREDDTDVTHLDRMTTCTPGSRFQMKKTVRVAPAIAR